MSAIFHSFPGLNATGVYRSAVSVESWSDMPITNVVVRNAVIEFSGGGTAEQAKQTVRGPGVDARPLPAWGFYARNVQQFTLEDIRLSVLRTDVRPVIAADHVQRLTLDNVRFPRVPEIREPVVMVDVGTLNLHDTALK